MVTCFPQRVNLELCLSPLYGRNHHFEMHCAILAYTGCASKHVGLNNSVWKRALLDLFWKKRWVKTMVVHYDCQCRCIAKVSTPTQEEHVLNKRKATPRRKQIVDEGCQCSERNKRGELRRLRMRRRRRKGMRGKREVWVAYIILLHNFMHDFYKFFNNYSYYITIYHFKKLKKK